MEENALPLRSRQELLYDWFKHLTSLSLVTLGGVLSLSQVDSIELKPRSLLLVVGLVAAGGICSFSGADKLVRAQTSGAPLPRSIGWLQRGAAGLLGAGVGAFLGLFLEALR
jgi:hypothetical protein